MVHPAIGDRPLKCRSGCVSSQKRTGAPKLGLHERPNERQMERCLVVDDNAEFAENLAEILLSWCSEAIIATDPNSAIELLASKPFDLLVSDLKMPAIDGLQLI